jgi:hypothetical protein
MDSSQPTVFALVFITWGIITVVLVVLLSYRATVLREDDQITMNTAEQDHTQHKETVIARRSLLMGEIIVLSVISGVLLLTCVGFSVYRGFHNF